MTYRGSDLYRTCPVCHMDVRERQDGRLTGHIVPVAIPHIPCKGGARWADPAPVQPPKKRSTRRKARQ